MRPLIFFLSLTMLSQSVAQTPIVTDNFDAYPFPGTVATSPGTIWDTGVENGGGSAADAALNNTIFSSPGQSLFVEGDEPGGDFVNNLFLRLPNEQTYTSGVFEVKMKIYIEDGFGGYFNLGGSWQGYTIDHEIGARVLFHEDGTGQLDFNSPVTFNYNIEAWNDIRVVVDMDSNTKDLFVNDALIASDDPWEATDGFGLLNFIGIGFASADLAEFVKGEMYVDDVEINALTPLSTEENELDRLVTIYPSPNNGQFTLRLDGQSNALYSIKVFDLSSKLVYEAIAQNTASETISLDVEAGVYLVDILCEGKHARRRVVIN